MSVRMLWEPTDPATALRDRFGFADESDALRWLAEMLRAEFGMRVAGCSEIVMSDTNALAWVTDDSGARLIVKWSVAAQKFARLDALAGLTAWLAGQGLPVSSPLTAHDGRLQVVRDGRSIGVQRVIDAHLLDVTDPAQVRDVGAVLARLHAALATAPAAMSLSALEQPSGTTREQLSGFLAAPPEHLPREAVTVLRQRFALLEPAALDGRPAQLLHGDVRAANILVRDGRVVAMLDIEEATWGQPVVELARSAVLLGTRFHHWAPVDRQVRDTLLQGYETVRPLTAEERDWWNTLVLWWSLMMVPEGEDPTGWGAAALDQCR